MKYSLLTVILMASACYSGNRYQWSGAGWPALDDKTAATTIAPRVPVSPDSIALIPGRDALDQYDVIGFVASSYRKHEFVRHIAELKARAAALGADAIMDIHVDLAGNTFGIAVKRRQSVVTGSL